jgi:tetratricopeptide (TPR) repeat protein
MRRTLLILGFLICLALGGCSGGADSDSTNENGNVSTSSPDFTDANLALAEGTKFLDTGEIDKAIDALNQAVKIDPDLAEAWFRLGIAYALAEMRDETLPTTSPVEANEKSKNVKTNSEKAFEKAVTAYKKRIDANPDDDVAHFNLGRAYNKLNEDEDAAKALKQAVKLKPDDTEYQTELGAILIKLAQYQAAIPPLKKALELDPENIRAQELLEDAQAGRSRVNYTSTPKEDKKTSNTNSNANTNTEPAGSKPPPLPTPVARPETRPTAARSPQ